MKPLYVLLGTFIICLLVTKLIMKDYDYLLSGRIAMSVMLVFTAIGNQLSEENVFFEILLPADS